METKLNTQLAKLVQLQHPQKVLAFARNMDDKVLAAIYGIDVDTYLLVKSQLTQQAKAAAEQLLQLPDFAARVDRLPFKAGEIVVGLGESTTDDSLSWFEILRHLLELRRPQDAIRLINEGISGHTSTQVLSRINGIAAGQPNWILCMIGGNDTMRVGPDSAKPLVSLEETAKNLHEIRRIAAARSKSNWVWITPSTVDEERAAAFTHFQLGQLSWRNEDILAVGDLIRSMSDPVIDTLAVIGLPAQAAYMGIDGVHPTIEGHKAIVRRVVESLSEGKER
ncbi:SGNH/GDSL hydrolase family protein [Paenibacillus spongiae]|uniref:SGNH/GDSL hydrolase family protein n=1 Tax=Paenibacillus spongiae TaxID=2909671 RepID=A0ABY5S0E9_9BACL|nr:SGNH/GDSL hydrolase family protein [Paenibacillus spongiae]UVI27317.1 SGNH/GDSL hydrolase family protein [Paenibacillus spongiae]